MKALLRIRIWPGSNLAKDSYVLFDLKGSKKLSKVNILALIRR